VRILSDRAARGWRACCYVAIAAAGCLATARAQLGESIVDLLHPAIAYGAPTRTDPIADLERRLAAGEARLSFAGPTGYLRSLLDALSVPIESQIVVFSKTSLQAGLISPTNPRTIFFNDSVAVAWMRGGFIEIAAHDPRQGAVFYTLPQNGSVPPAFVRDGRCLGCHYSHAALGVSGFLVRSIPTAVDGSTLPWLGNLVPNHTSPLAERWAGWYVSGSAAPAQHLGNLLLADKQAAALPEAVAPITENLEQRFQTSGYLTPYSDAAALLVFEHQMHMMNVLTRIGWEARVAANEGRDVASLARSVGEAVDYLLFVDEAPIGRVRGTSGFAEKFAARGPRDGQGRSLRDLRLNGRLLEYPLSYMIYSDAFASLDVAVKQAIYRRLWQVLSGAEPQARYANLTPGDRQAIVEILIATQKDLPDYFRSGDP
jgi:hypothetical protein